MGRIQIATCAKTFVFTHTHFVLCEDMFESTWVELMRDFDAKRSMVPESLVRLFRSQSDVDHVSETEEEVLPPTRSPSPPWSDDEAWLLPIIWHVLR